MVEEYFVYDITTWLGTNKGQNELQNELRTLKHVKVKGTDLENFVKMVDTLVDDINYKYPKCKAMTSRCSKMFEGLILLTVRAGTKDVASLKLYPIRNIWKENTK